MKPMYRKSIPKPQPARETHESIRTQTEAFLRRGGRVQVVPQGFTGITEIAGPAQRHRHLRFPR